MSWCCMRNAPISAPRNQTAHCGAAADAACNIVQPDAAKPGMPQHPPQPRFPQTRRGSVRDCILEYGVDSNATTSVSLLVTHHRVVYRCLPRCAQPAPLRPKSSTSRKPSRTSSSNCCNAACCFPDLMTPQWTTSSTPCFKCPSKPVPPSSSESSFYQAPVRTAHQNQAG